MDAVIANDMTAGQLYSLGSSGIERNLLVVLEPSRIGRYTT